MRVAIHHCVGQGLQDHSQSPWTFRTSGYYTRSHTELAGRPMAQGDLSCILSVINSCLLVWVGADI